MAAETDLFGQTSAAPPRMLPGLRSWDAVVTPEQESKLITRIDESDLEPFRFQGWIGKRLTRSFGWTYDFDNGRFEQGPSLPEWLLPVREIAAAAVGMPSDLFAQALVIRYDAGAGIGWHRDRPVFDHVIGVSLGNVATLRFRRRRDHGFDRFAHQALPRGIYHLSGEARHGWEHSIAALPVPRWSITFRSISEPRGQHVEILGPRPLT